MVRRCLIRALFLLPVLLCVVGWGISSAYSASLWYMRENGDYVGCATYDGMCYLDAGRNFNGDPGWNGSIGTPHSAVMMPVRYTAAAPESTYEFLGFGFFYYPEGGPHTPRIFHVPCGFLLLFFSGLLFLVWRKTRPRPPGGAFPVELTGMGGTGGGRA